MKKKKKKGMKGTLFLTGLASGMALTVYWRSLAKSGIKLGMQATQKINELSQKAREEIEDLAAEAQAESAQPGAKPSDKPAGGVH